MQQNNNGLDESNKQTKEIDDLKSMNMSNSNNTTNNNNNNSNNNNTTNNNSTNNSNNITNPLSNVQIGSTQFPFDLSNWENSADLNVLFESQQNIQNDSPNVLSNIYSPAALNSLNLSNINLANLNNLNNMTASNNITNNNLNFLNAATANSTPTLNPTNTQPNINSNAASPANYASQLQHYQNLLLETQNLLNMKQLQQQQQQNSPNNASSPSHSNFASTLNLAQLQQQQNSGLSNFSNQALMQQQILQLAQAQLSNNNKTLSNITFNSNDTNPLFLNNGLLSNQLQSNLNNTNNNMNNKNVKSKKKIEPPQPRTKVRPCDHCRRRKIKCVMIPDLHTCKMCQTKGIKCTFNEMASFKRNLSNSDQDNKRMKFEDPTIEPPPNIAVRDTHPIKDYATMQGHSLLKKTLSLQFPRSSFYVGPTSIYDPLFLDKVSLDKIDQFQLNKSNSIRKVANSIQFLLRDDFSELLYQQSERDSDTVEKYVAPHGQTLINLYFRTVHPSFPVLHKKIFLEKYARTHREFGAPLLAAVYILAIQWWDYEPKLANLPKPDVTSLYRFAMRTFLDVIQRPKLSAVQAGLLLLQCQSLSFSVSNITNFNSKSKDNDNKKTKIDNKDLSNSNNKSNNVSNNGGNNSTSNKYENILINQNNWLLCTQVVGLAEELGLGLDCSNWRLPKWERGLRCRLAWAVYVQDKWSSLVESRPSHIQEDINWLVKPLTDEDFPEKSNLNDKEKDEFMTCVDIELGKETFKYTVLLANILSEIQNELYTPRAMQNIRQIDQILRIVKPLQLKLRNWYHSLPKDLQMGANNLKHFSANGNLQLQYFATEITLHRRIISTLYEQDLNLQQSNNNNSNSNNNTNNNNSNNNSNTNTNSNNGSPISNVESTQENSQSGTPQDKTTTNKVGPPPQLIKVCRNAAKTRLTASIEYVRELKLEHMHSFWHSSAARNFALIGIFATLLYITSSDPDEALIYREHIMDYKWILKNNSSKFNIAKEALELIEGVVKNIPGLLNEYDGVSIGHLNNNTSLNIRNRQFSNKNLATSKDSNDKSANNSNANTPGNINNNSKITSNNYNYDSSNGVSPCTVVSPNGLMNQGNNNNNSNNASNSVNNNFSMYKNIRKGNNNSTLSTPTNTTNNNISHHGSPLHNEAGNSNSNKKLHAPKSRPRSPVLLMNNNSNNNEDNNSQNSGMKSPTPATTPTLTLLSQSRSHTPVSVTDNNTNNNNNTGKNNNSNNNDDMKQKVEKLFTSFDGQQSLLNMTNVLGITDGEEGMNGIKKLNPLNNNSSNKKEAENLNPNTSRIRIGTSENNRRKSTEIEETIKEGEERGNEGTVDMDVLNQMQKMLGLDSSLQ